MICHLSEVYATAVINVLLRIVATSDTEEATSSNLVTPTMNYEARGICFWPLCLLRPPDARAKLSKSNSDFNSNNAVRRCLYGTA